MPGDQVSGDARKALLDMLYRLLRTTAADETRRRAQWLVWWIEGRDPIAMLRLADTGPSDGDAVTRVAGRKQ